MPRARKSNIHVDVSFTVRRRLLSVARVRKAVAAALSAERIHDALVSVAFVGLETMTRLNAEFLAHDGPTDVISFGLKRAGKNLAVIGDIYICPQIAARNAKSLRVSAREELTRLVIHGTLHVLGYDHPEGEQRIRSAMWKRQEKILASVH